MGHLLEEKSNDIDGVFADVQYLIQQSIILIIGVISKQEELERKRVKQEKVQVVVLENSCVPDMVKQQHQNQAVLLVMLQEALHHLHQLFEKKILLMK